MIVSELIELLKKQPQDIKVAYRKHSEQCLLNEKDIDIFELCPARPDGWIQNYRPDVLTETYLLLPGN